RAGHATGDTWRVPAQDHARRDGHRYSHPRGHRDQSWGPGHPRRPHAGHRRRHEDAGVADRATDITDMAFVGAAIVIGGLIGALVFKVSGVPLTLSTAGGALIAGIIG